MGVALSKRAGSEEQVEVVAYEVVSMRLSDLDAAAVLYRRLWLQEAQGAFSSARDEAAAALRGALSATDGLRSGVSGLIAERPEVLDLLSAACDPPLARDKLALLSGVPAHRVVALAAGEPVASARGSVRRACEDLPALAGTLVRHLPADAAPWLPESRPPTDAEAERFCAVAADRVACRSLGSRAAEGVVLAGERMAAAWLDEAGYSDRGGIRSLSELPERSYARLASREGGLFARAGEGGAPLHLHVKVLADAPAASKASGPLLKAAGRDADDGAGSVFVLCGCIGAAAVARISDAGLRYAWLHDLDGLRTCGL